MNRYIPVKTTLPLLIALSAPAQLPAAQGPAPEVNRAQALVFMGEHLRDTRPGQTLVYDFTRHASGEPDQTDQVRMTVTGVRGDAARDLSFEFLSGADHLDFPSTQGYRGNPIAIQFLEWDINNMAQATGTPAAYLRERIRRAFRHPQIREEQIDVGGTRVEATEIEVTPFAQDPSLSHLEGYADKRYRFSYSDQVPGDLVAVGTRMSGADGASLEEELRFSSSTVTP